VHSTDGVLVDWRHKEEDRSGNKEGDIFFGKGKGKKKPLLKLMIIGAVQSSHVIASFFCDAFFMLPIENKCGKQSTSQR
jgi:hypothetical protein